MDRFKIYYKVSINMFYFRLLMPINIVAYLLFKKVWMPRFVYRFELVSGKE